MPMVYVSKRTLELIEQVFEHLRKNTAAPSRIMKADVIHTALDEYVRKMGLKKR